MMRAISNGQVEGFPTPAMCRSIFIENDIQGSQLNMNVREFLVDSIGFGIVLDLAAAEQALKVGGFTQVMCDGKITQLSGGWKMKLALIRATLEKADIMLMVSKINKKRKSVQFAYMEEHFSDFQFLVLPLFLHTCFIVITVVFDFLFLPPSNMLHCDRLLSSFISKTIQTNLFLTYITIFEHLFYHTLILTTIYFCLGRTNESFRCN